jgi:hypothetical protein
VISGGRRRLLAVLLALGAGLAVLPPVSAATLPTAGATPGPVPYTPAAPGARAPVPAPPPRAVAASPAPTAAPTPLPDPSAGARRRLRSLNDVEEGFLLGLPGAGPKGPTAYVPPEPRRDSGDAALVLFAAAAGLLVAIGSGAVLLVAVLRPRAAPEAPPVRASVALRPERGRQGRVPERRRRTTQLSQEVFDRLPPLLQLALLDRAGPQAEGGPEEAGAPAPPPAG